jgi:hypothetical protein
VLTLQDVIRELRESNATAPQPEGKEVADAYKSGELDTTTGHLLHIIAILLRKARDGEPLPPAVPPM